MALLDTHRQRCYKIASMSKRLLESKEVADLLGISGSLLRKWRQDGVYLPFIKLGDGPKAPVRYREHDVEAYLQTATRAPRKEAT